MLLIWGPHLENGSDNKAEAALPIYLSENKDLHILSAPTFKMLSRYPLLFLEEPICSCLFREFLVCITIIITKCQQMTLVRLHFRVKSLCTTRTLRKLPRLQLRLLSTRGSLCRGLTSGPRCTPCCHHWPRSWFVCQVATLSCLTLWASAEIVLPFLSPQVFRWWLVGTTLCWLDLQPTQLGSEPSCSTSFSDPDLVTNMES